MFHVDENRTGYSELLYAVYESAIYDSKKSYKEQNITSALKLIHDDPYGFFTDQNVHDGVIKKCYSILIERGFNHVVRRFTTNG